MNAERLLEVYEQISEAPDAIARLRRFMLDLAVRGKLVEQDARDEPASELLVKIDQERKRLHAQNEIKKPKKLPPVDSVPFDLPSSWVWARIRDVTSDRGQEIPSAKFTYIDVSAIDKKAGVVSDPKVLGPEEAPSRARKITRKGDVIYSCVRPYLLNVAVITEHFEPAPIASTAFAILNGYDLVLPWYLWIALRSPFMVECVERDQRGQSYPAINDKDFSLLPLPLPPLAEQHRIVAKVDELMALCDRLEDARNTREEVRDKLTAASLARLTAPDTMAEDFPTHAAFALEALPALTTRPDQIKTLRQTILNLAVHGKLVEQDAAEGVTAPDAVVAASDEPFELPASWSWQLFGSLAEMINGDRSKNYPSRNEYQPSGVAWINTGHIQPDGSLDLSGMHYISREKFDTLRSGKVQPGDLVYCLRGATFGKTGFVEPFEEGAIASSLMILRLGPEIDRKFAYNLLMSPYGKEQLLRFDNGTAQPNLSAGNVRKYLIPLPPVAEQHRIVAKVDTLMALCDRLEAALTTADTTRTRLLEALLHEALEPKSEVLEAAE